MTSPFYKTTNCTLNITAYLCLVASTQAKPNSSVPDDTLSRAFWGILMLLLMEHDKRSKAVPKGTVAQTYAMCYAT